MRQLGNIDFVESQVRRIAAEVNIAGVPMESNPTPSTALLTTRYHIALDTKKPLVLGKWLINHPNDPALKVLVSRNNSYQFSHVTIELPSPSQATSLCTPPRIQPNLRPESIQGSHHSRWHSLSALDHAD